MTRPAVDSVKVEWIGVGTGTMTLGAAIAGFQGFPASLDGMVVSYSIEHQTLGERENGLGTYTASGGTLSRDFISFSTNANARVVFSAGTKHVRLSALALDLVENRAASDPTVTDDIDSGYIAGRSRWLNTTSRAVFICTDDSAGAAVWVSITAGGGGGADDQTAAEVEFTPAGGIAAENVQDAIEELDSEKLASADLASGTITPRTGALNLSGGSDGDVWTVQVDGSAAFETPSAATVNVDQYDIVARIATGTGSAGGLASADLTEEATPAAGDFLLGWESGGALRKFDVGDLPSGGGTDDQTASEVAFTPSGDLAATDVQAALEELDVEKAALTDFPTFIYPSDTAESIGAKFQAGGHYRFTAGTTYSLAGLPDDLIISNDLHITGDGPELVKIAIGGSVKSDVVKRFLLRANLHVSGVTFQDGAILFSLDGLDTRIERIEMSDVVATNIGPLLRANDTNPNAAAELGTLRFENVRCTNVHSGIGLRLGDGAASANHDIPVDRIEVVDCSVIGFDLYGIVVNYDSPQVPYAVADSSAYVSGCLVQDGLGTGGSTGFGMNLTAVRSAHVEGCRFENIRLGTRSDFEALYTKNEDFKAVGCTFVLCGDNQAMLGLKGDDDAQLVRFCEVASCDFFGDGDVDLSGIWYQGQRAHIHHNRFFGNWGNSAIRFNPAVSARETTIEHNTIYISGTPAASGAQRGIFAIDLAPNLAIRGNRIFVDGKTTATFRAIEVQSGSSVGLDIAKPLIDGNQIVKLAGATGAVVGISLNVATAAAGLISDPQILRNHFDGLDTGIELRSQPITGTARVRGNTEIGVTTDVSNASSSTLDEALNSWNAAGGGSGDASPTRVATTPTTHPLASDELAAVNVLLHAAANTDIQVPTGASPGSVWLVEVDPSLTVTVSVATDAGSVNGVAGGSETAVAGGGAVMIFVTGNPGTAPVARVEGAIVATTTLSDTLDADGQQIVGAELRDYAETCPAASVSGAVVVDFAAGQTRDLTLTADATSLTVNNWPASGIRGTLALRVDLAGFAWVDPAGTTWPGGAAPDLGTGVVWISYSTSDAGTTVDGFSDGGDRA